ncbi:hypothetical protein HK099_005105 [Clydaea vesicula]|uniref:C5orf34-like C-terminal domain-containing protein n=1 Tax=Clydaea vesicula TaxID=447962 RepID=A0AAD5XV54_9FUNG|nr:hypothetical protein HK099_005105 [Clydaea vesicula]
MTFFLFSDGTSKLKLDSKEIELNSTLTTYKVTKKNSTSIHLLETALVDQDLSNLLNFKIKYSPQLSETPVLVTNKTYKSKYLLKFSRWNKNNYYNNSLVSLDKLFSIRIEGLLNWVTVTNPILVQQHKNNDYFLYQICEQTFHISECPEHWEKPLKILINKHLNVNNNNDKLNLGENLEENSYFSVELPESSKSLKDSCNLFPLNSTERKQKFLRVKLEHDYLFYFVIHRWLGSSAFNTFLHSVNPTFQEEEILIILPNDSSVLFILNELQFLNFYKPVYAKGGFGLLTFDAEGVYKKGLKRFIDESDYKVYDLNHLFSNCLNLKYQYTLSKNSLHSDLNKTIADNANHSSLHVNKKNAELLLEKTINGVGRFLSFSNNTQICYFEDGKILEFPVENNYETKKNSLIKVFDRGDFFFIRLQNPIGYKNEVLNLMEFRNWCDNRHLSKSINTNNIDVNYLDDDKTSQKRFNIKFYLEKNKKFLES